MKGRSIFIVMTLMAAGVMFVWAEPPAPTTRPARRLPFPPPTTGPGDRASSQPTTRPGRRGRAMTEQQMAELLGWLQVNQPTIYKHAEELKKTDEPKFRAFMHGIAWLRADIEDMPADLQRRSWRIREDNVRVAEFLKQYRVAETEEAKAKIIPQLRNVLLRQFIDTQKLKEYQLELLSRQLDEVRRQLAERMDRRDELVDERLLNLLEGGDLDESPDGRLPGGFRPPPDRRPPPGPLGEPPPERPPGEASVGNGPINDLSATVPATPLNRPSGPAESQDD